MLHQVILSPLQVVVGCLSAVSAAPFYGLVSHPNGAVVPVDEPSVAAARAEHLAAKGAIAYTAPALAHAGYAAAAPVLAPAGYAAAAPALAPAGYAAHVAAPIAYSTGTVTSRTESIS